MSTPSRGRRERQQGAVLVWVAFFLLFMLGFIALGVDAAKLMATRTQLQNAADAAALAGASALDVTTGALVQEQALARATETAANNHAFMLGDAPVTLLPGDVSFPAPNEVQVTVRRSPDAGGSMITHIAQVLGITSLQVAATATAKAESASSVCEGIVPMAPVENPAEPFQTGCAHEYQLKIGAQGNSQGNFQLLDFPICDEGPCAGMSGGAAIRCQVAHGYSCCIKLDQKVDTQPGNKVGPFSQGLADRWSLDSCQVENICYEEYIARGGSGQRVVLVPIVRTFDVDGKKPVDITGFAAFFLKSKPSGGGSQTLAGEFLYMQAPAESGGGTSSSTNTLYAIRLIR